jgi:hypothetical protein
MRLSCIPPQRGPAPGRPLLQGVPSFWESNRKGYLEVEVHALYFFNILKSIPPFHQSYLAPFLFDILSDYVHATLSADRLDEAAYAHGQPCARASGEQYAQGMGQKLFQT